MKLYCFVLNPLKIPLKYIFDSCFLLLFILYFKKIKYKHFRKPNRYHFIACTHSFIILFYCALSRKWNSFHRLNAQFCYICETTNAIKKNYYIYWNKPGSADDKLQNIIKFVSNVKSKRLYTSRFMEINLFYQRNTFLTLIIAIKWWTHFNTFNSKILL